jgi:hypothetical protein
MTHSLIPIRYSDDVETVPEDELDTIARIVSTLRDILQSNSQQRGERARDVHVKSHGCAKAILTVEKDLPPEYAQGLLAAPAKYPAVLRFSNTNPFRHWDLLPDARGLALQVSEVPGEFLASDQGNPTQEFLMANHLTFIAPDAKGYLELQQARANAKLMGLFSTTRKLATAISAWRLPKKAASSVLQIASQFPRHPAAYSYYSMVPIRFGDYVAKYRVRPSAGADGGLLVNALWNANAMQTAFDASLREKGFVLDFQIQLCTSQSSMPIEDASVRWSEDQSAFQTVAKIHVPSQEVMPTKSFEDHSLRFDVWHALVAHQPLGGINRTRRAAYPVSVEWRSSQSK